MAEAQREHAAVTEESESKLGALEAKWQAEHAVAAARWLAEKDSAAELQAAMAALEESSQMAAPGSAAAAEVPTVFNVSLAVGSTVKYADALFLFRVKHLPQWKLGVAALV